MPIEEPSPVRANTIAAHIQRTGGRSSGFDYLRLLLAFMVIFTHSFTVTRGQLSDLDFTHPAARPFIHLVLPMFFGLSGFLVSGSLERCPTPITFFGLRALRIVPALAVEICLSALILGPILTAYALPDYYADPQFRHYFLNIVGDIHFTLPGLFLHNPRPATVNGQLWTIPAELHCYALLGALAATGIVRRRGWLLAAAVGGVLLWVGVAISRPPTAEAVHNGANVPVLVLCFLLGVTAYRWRDRIPLNRPLLLAALAAALVLGFVPSGALLLPVPAVYLTIYLGLLDPPRLWAVRSGDYSYGVYLYGFPVQQTYASVPALREWYLNVTLSAITVFGLALFSWHAIEKPATRLRRVLPGIEATLARLALGGAAASPGPALDRPFSAAWAICLALGIGAVALMLNAHGQWGVWAALAAFAFTIVRARTGQSGRAPAAA